jgi:hypothetical protein
VAVQERAGAVERAALFRSGRAISGSWGRIVRRDGGVAVGAAATAPDETC